MKNLSFRLSGTLVAALLFIGQITPFCVFTHYQSEVPETLRR